MEMYKARHKIPDKFQDIVPFKPQGPSEAPGTAPEENVTTPPPEPGTTAPGAYPGAGDQTKGPGNRSSEDTAAPKYTVTISGARSLDQPAAPPAPAPGPAEQTK
jgi:hypothetical protein